MEKERKSVKKKERRGKISMEEVKEKKKEERKGLKKKRK